MDKKSIDLSKTLAIVVRLIRTTFWQFPSYKLAKHPCILTFALLKTIKIWINILYCVKKNICFCSEYKRKNYLGLIAFPMMSWSLSGRRLWADCSRSRLKCWRAMRCFWCTFWHMNRPYLKYRWIIQPGL